MRLPADRRLFFVVPALALLLIVLFAGHPSCFHVFAVDDVTIVKFTVPLGSTGGHVIVNDRAYSVKVPLLGGEVRVTIRGNVTNLAVAVDGFFGRRWLFPCTAYVYTIRDLHPQTLVTTVIQRYETTISTFLTTTTTSTVVLERTVTSFITKEITLLTVPIGENVTTITLHYTVTSATTISHTRTLTATITVTVPTTVTKRETVTLVRTVTHTVTQREVVTSTVTQVQTTERSSAEGIVIVG